MLKDRKPKKRQSKAKRSDQQRRAGIIQYVKMIDVKMIVVIDPENSKKFTRHSGLDPESRSANNGLLNMRWGRLRGQ